MKLNWKTWTMLFTLVIIAVFSFADSEYYWYQSSEGGETAKGFTRPKEDDVLLIAAGGKSDIYTSNDGINWTKQPFEQDDKSWFAHTLSGNTDKFVLGGKCGNGANQNGFAYSENGRSWSNSEGVKANSVHDITWSEEKDLFVAVGTVKDKGIQYSENGITWSNATFNTSPDLDLYGVAYGEGRFIAVGKGHKKKEDGPYNSSDGKNWTAETSFPNGSDLYSVAYGNEKFVAVGNGVITYLDESDEWVTEGISGFDSKHTLNKIIWNPHFGIFIALSNKKKGSSNVYTSEDGIEWEAHDTGVNSNLRDITWSEELESFFIVGHAGNGFGNNSSNVKLLKSSDGKSWTNITESINAVNFKINQLKLETIFAKPKITPTIQKTSIYTKDGFYINSVPKIEADVHIQSDNDSAKKSWASSENVINGDIYVEDPFNEDALNSFSSGEVKIKDFNPPSSFCNGIPTDLEDPGTRYIQKDYDNGLIFPTAYSIENSVNCTVNGGIYATADTAYDENIALAGCITIKGDIYAPHFHQIAISGGNKDTIWTIIEGSICSEDTEEIIISGDVKIYGGIYAPNAKLKIHTAGTPDNFTQIYGDIYVRKITIENNCDDVVIEHQ